MAKRTIGFDDYEGRQYDEYTGEDPRPNAWYTGEVVRIRYDGEEDQIIFFVKLVDHPDYEGWTRGWYAPFEGDRKWKSQDMILAVQGGLEKPVSLDWENEAAVANFVKKCKRIRFQTDEYNDRITIRKVRPLLEKAGEPKGSTKPAEPEEDDEAADEPYTEQELKGLKVEELEEILQEEFDDELPEKPGRDPKGIKYRKLLVDTILELQETGEEDDEEGDFDESGFADDAEGDEDAEDDEKEEEEPEPPARTRRSRTAAKAAPAKAEPATRARRTRR